MGAKVHREDLVDAIIRFGPIQREENATGCSYHGANKVALGDLYIDTKIAEKPVDPFHTVFGRSLLGHGQVATHLGNP